MSVTAVPLQPVKPSYKIWLWCGIAIAFALAFLLAWIGTGPVRAQRLPVDEDARFLAWHKSQPGIITTKSGLQYQIIRAGKGATPGDGDFAMIGVEGRLRDGTTFQPYASSPMRVGDGIAGFNEAMKMMPKGARYRIWVPADQGYGKNPQPLTGMTDKSMLIFDVDMFNFVSEAELRKMQEEQMRQQLQAMPPMDAPVEGNGAAPDGNVVVPDDAAPEDAPKKK